MIKKLFLSGILLFCIGILNGQINPVQWNYSARKTGTNTWELHITAFIGNDWHLYAQDAGEDLLSTVVKFKNNPLVTIDGKLSEAGELKKVYDPGVKMTLKYYHGQVSFIQRIRLKKAASTLVNGTVKYVVCSDKDNRCLPEKTVSFSIKIDGK